jgi:hypothetical protein
MISVASIHSIAAARADIYPPKTIALFCCVGLFMSLCLMTLGIDLDAGSV